MVVEQQSALNDTHIFSGGNHSSNTQKGSVQPVLPTIPLSLRSGYRNSGPSRLKETLGLAKSSSSTSNL